MPTYERPIEHCSASPYVKEVTIKTVEPAQNSDFLDILTFEEIGWNAITKRGEYIPSQKVWFIPPESVLPKELSDIAGVTNYLNKGKVRVTRLRGNRSEGLILSKELVEQYLDYIMQWEDLPFASMRGHGLPASEISPYWEIFYKIPNILNEPYTFQVGEEIGISEKIHGTNLRVGILKHPQTEMHTRYVGSHRVTFKLVPENDDVLYIQAINRLELWDKLPNDFLFFGEVFGRKAPAGQPIQTNFDYGRTNTDILFFSAMYEGKYLSVDSFNWICDKHSIPRVQFHRTHFTTIEELRTLAEQPSEITNKHIREGIVISSLTRPGIMAKCISFKYLTQKTPSTERH